MRDRSRTHWTQIFRSIQDNDLSRDRIDCAGGHLSGTWTDTHKTVGLTNPAEIREDQTLALMGSLGHVYLLIGESSE
jgi:hypothetical protein